MKQEREERGGRRGSECEAGERRGEVGEGVSVKQERGERGGRRGSECEAGERGEGR